MLIVIIIIHFYVIRDSYGYIIDLRLLSTKIYTKQLFSQSV